jgi:hypothetical protein
MIETSLRWQDGSKDHDNIHGTDNPDDGVCDFSSLPSTAHL